MDILGVSQVFGNMGNNHKPKVEQQDNKTHYIGFSGLAGPTNALSSKEFEQVYNSGNISALSKLIDNAPLGNKLPTWDDLSAQDYTTDRAINTIISQKYICGNSTITLTPQADRTTIAVYKNGNLTQTVIYDENGNIKQGEIKSNDGISLHGTKVSYFVNEKGKMDIFL